MNDAGAFQPAERFGRDMDVVHRRERHRLVAAGDDGIQTPEDQHHDHDSCDLHDAEGLFARLVDSDDVLAPEIDGDEYGKTGGEVFGMHVGGMEVEIVNGFVEKSGEVEAGADAADGP